jgi:hypothetical protein
VLECPSERGLRYVLCLVTVAQDQREAACQHWECNVASEEVGWAWVSHDF